MTLRFDHTHDIDLGVSRSESEIALSQEWGGRLTMNEKDVSHPFMTMILTCVTMLRWADVPDSDRGDFSRRCAVDISSFVSNMCMDINNARQNQYIQHFILIMMQTFMQGVHSFKKVLEISLQCIIRHLIPIKIPSSYSDHLNV